MLADAFSQRPDFPTLFVKWLQRWPFPLYPFGSTIHHVPEVKACHSVHPTILFGPGYSSAGIRDLPSAVLVMDENHWRVKSLVLELAVRKSRITRGLWYGMVVVQCDGVRKDTGRGITQPGSEVFCGIIG